MKEIICLSLGQAGTQIGDELWKLLRVEHRLNFDGSINSENSEIESERNHHVIFRECGNGNFSPRSLMIDTEPLVIDNVRNGVCRDLFHSDNFVNGKEDAADNFARGRYSIGKELLDQTVDSVRKLIEEDCQNLQSFVIFHSMGGGTGSGFAASVLEELKDRYLKKTFLGFSLFPSGMYYSITEPYNAVLSTASLRSKFDANIMFDNHRLYRVCERTMGIMYPNYRNTNHLISQVFSSLTSSMRTTGSDSFDINAFLTNTIPYPNLHFFLTSIMGPTLSLEKLGNETFDVFEMTRRLFQKSSILSSCHPSYGKFISCCLLYRGNDISPLDVFKTLVNIDHARNGREKWNNYRTVKNKPCSWDSEHETRRNTMSNSYYFNQYPLQFTDWSLCHFKCSISPSPSIFIPHIENNYSSSKNFSSFGGNRSCKYVEVDKSACMLGNTTAISRIFDTVDRRFDLMYSKRAFCHWYVREGMEIREFQVARENLAILENDYTDGEVDYVSSFEEIDEMDGEYTVNL